MNGIRWRDAWVAGAVENPDVHVTSFTIVGVGDVPIGTDDEVRARRLIRTNLVDDSLPPEETVVVEVQRGGSPQVIQFMADDVRTIRFWR